MGRGDIRTKKGKIKNKSFGKSRPRKKKKSNQRAPTNGQLVKP